MAKQVFYSTHNPPVPVKLLPIPIPAVWEPVYPHSHAVYAVVEIIIDRSLSI